MRMLEQTCDKMRTALVALHPTAQPALQLVLRSRRRMVAQLRLDRVVEVLVGIEFRAVRREEAQLNLLVMCFNPFTDLLGAMYLQVVHNQEDLTVGGADESLQELEKDGDLQCPPVHHEAQLSTIGECRNHAHRETGGLGSGDRGAAST